MLSVLVVCALQLALSTQSSVYVKFLSPPHGYSHDLQVGLSGVAMSKESRIYTGDNRHFGIQQSSLANQFRPNFNLNSHFQHQPKYNGNRIPDTRQQSPPGYFYNRPQTSFGYNPPSDFWTPPTEYSTFGLPKNGMMYDSALITGPEAVRYIALLFSRGELFFHLIPHKRLVLVNQQDRVANNLSPHVLASIRPGHPFFHR